MPVFTRAQNAQKPFDPLFKAPESYVKSAWNYDNKLMREAQAQIRTQPVGASPTTPYEIAFLVLLTSIPVGISIQFGMDMLMRRVYVAEPPSNYMFLVALWEKIMTVLSGGATP